MTPPAKYKVDPLFKPGEAVLLVERSRPFVNGDAVSTTHTRTTTVCVLTRGVFVEASESLFDCHTGEEVPKDQGTYRAIHHPGQCVRKDK